MHNLDLMIRNIAIGLAILIIFPITVSVGIDIVNPKPEESQFLVESVASKSSKRDEEPTIDRQAYEAALSKHRQLSFGISVVCGLIAIAVGAFIQIPFIGLGFILGGSVSLTVGYVAYWNVLNKILQLISLILALILLVFSAYWQSRKKMDGVRK